MVIYAKVAELQEISTGIFTVRFHDGVSEEISEETATYLVGMFPNYVQLQENS